MLEASEFIDSSGATNQNSSKVTKSSLKIFLKNVLTYLKITNTFLHYFERFKIQCATLQQQQIKNSPRLPYDLND